MEPTDPRDRWPIIDGPAKTRPGPALSRASGPPTATSGSWGSTPSEAGNLAAFVAGNPARRERAGRSRRSIASCSSGISSSGAGWRHEGL